MKNSLYDKIDVAYARNAIAQKTEDDLRIADTGFPCPFCHAHGDELKSMDLVPGRFLIYCSECCAIGPRADSAAEALSLWNCGESAAEGERWSTN